MRTVAVALTGLVCVAIGVVLDATFLSHQSLWADEVTQLSGVAMGPWTLIQWLADRVNFDDLGAADDRMPPLSYLIQWSWSKLVDPSETSMRWLSLLATALATWIVFASATRTWGLVAGAAAGLLFATSPNVITISVEIRAYPFLILFSAGLCSCLLGYTAAESGSRTKWLVGMLVFGVLAIYTHFFGLVVLGGCLASSFLIALWKRESVIPVLATGAAIGVLAVGMLPFIMASQGLSVPRSLPLSVRLTSVVQLFYRQLAHPSTALSQVAVGLAFLGAALGLVVALAGIGSAKRPAWALGLTIGMGLVVVIGVQLIQTLFPAASPNYNVWILPALFLLLSSSLSGPSPALGRLASTGLFLLLLANLYSDYQLVTRGDYYAHNPHRFIASTIRQVGVEGLAIVFDNDMQDSWIAYQATRRDFQNQIPHYIVVPNDNAEDRDLWVEDFPKRQRKVKLSELPATTLVVIHQEQQNSKSLADHIKGNNLEIKPGPFVGRVLADGGWERVEHQNRLAFMAATIDVFRKAKRP